MGDDMAKLILNLELKLKRFYVPKGVYQQMTDGDIDGVTRSEGKIYFNGTEVEVGNNGEFDVDLEPVVMEKEVTNEIQT